MNQLWGSDNGIWITEVIFSLDLDSGQSPKKEDFFSKIMYSVLVALDIIWSRKLVKCKHCGIQVELMDTI